MAARYLRHNSGIQADVKGARLLDDGSLLATVAFLFGSGTSLLEERVYLSDAGQRRRLAERLAEMTREDRQKILMRLANLRDALRQERAARESRAHDSGSTLVPARGELGRTTNGAAAVAPHLRSGTLRTRAGGRWSRSRTTWRLSGRRRGTALPKAAFGGRGTAI